MAPFYEGTALHTLGEVQLARGDSHDALTSFQRSAAIHRELADLSREGTALSSAGRAFHWHEAASLLGDFTDPKAIEFRIRAAELGSG
jgi:predicted metal-dependent enzyme (double-stranded beta helix superfamily)